MFSRVWIPKRSVCNQLLCHLLLECRIQKVCCYEMMCEEQCRRRKWIWKHPRPSSPGEKLVRQLFSLGGARTFQQGKPEQDWERDRKRQTEIRLVSHLFGVFRQHPGLGRAILALTVRTLCCCRWETMGAWEPVWGETEPGMLGGFSQGLHTWLHFCSMDMSVGEMDYGQCSFSAAQPPGVHWRGPEPALLRKHRCHRGFQGQVVIWNGSNICSLEGRCAGKAPGSSALAEPREHVPIWH